MILRSILHNAWIEWREQRSNLLGLWAGLLLLILAMGLFGGFDLVTDAASPYAFALLGYLGFVLAIMPRIFGGSTQRSTEAMQRRCPAGIHGNFMGKALFLNFAMALSALLPALTVIVLMYFAAPRSYEVLMNQRFGNPGLGLAIFALPLMLMTWRLPARWVVVVVPLTVAIILGALSFGVLGASTFEGGSPLFSGYSSIAILVMPWLLTWSSFTMTRGATNLRRSVVGLGFACLAVSPALGVGLNGYVCNGFSFTTFDHESSDFFIAHAYLGPNGQQAYLTSYDRRKPTNFADLLHHENDYREHALRVDLSTGSFEHWPNRRFLVPTEQGIQESGRASYPHVTALHLHGRAGGHSDSLHTVDLTTNELAPIDPEQFAVHYYRPNVQAMGLKHPWRTLDKDVGLGTFLWRLPNPESSNRALYDPSRSRVFYESELPFTLGGRVRRVLVLPGKWLIGPEEGDESWMRYDPDRNVLEPIQGLEQGVSVGRALPDGKVIVFKGIRFSLYNSNEDICEPLRSLSGPTEGPEWTFRDAMGSRQRCAPAHLIIVTHRDHSPRPLSDRDKPNETFLGRLDPDSNEIHWLPWLRQSRIVGAIDQDNLLVTQFSKRLARINLNTGEEQLIFPRPSILE
ncbi:MAG: hypothetical protein JKY61_07220 [Planctomycetes bacterium]|nr:hypothetical protein [Planctomycetota bacterium]